MLGLGSGLHTHKIKESPREFLSHQANVRAVELELRHLVDRRIVLRLDAARVGLRRSFDGLVDRDHLGPVFRNPRRFLLLELSPMFGSAGMNTPGWFWPSPASHWPPCATTLPSLYSSTRSPK